MAASNLSWFNSAINPIIYAILNPNFRKEYVRLMKTCGQKIQKKLCWIRSSLSQDQLNYRKNASLDNNMIYAITGN